MTIKNKNNDDMKGGSKVTKKPNAISSSLATIMKSGGLVAGMKGAKAKEKEKAYKAVVNTGMKSLKVTEDTQMADHEVDEPTKVKRSSGSGGTATEECIFWSAGGGAKVAGDMDIQMADNDEEIKIIGVKSGGKEEVPVSLVTVDEEIIRWEKEIKRIEEALERATVKERKESLMIQMSNAQVMLKQAMLVMTGKYQEKEREGKVLGERSTWNLLVGNINSFPNEIDGQNKYKLDKLKEPVIRGQTDILLISEHNRNIQNMQRKSQPLEILRKWWKNTIARASYLMTDGSKSIFEPGGTMIVTHSRATAHTCTAEQDTHYLGRWNSITLKGKRDHYTTIISIYRPTRYQETYNRQTAYTAKRRKTLGNEVSPESLWFCDLHQSGSRSNRSERFQR